MTGNRIYVTGIGPGSEKGLTFEAAEALQACDIIIGYTVYVELIRDRFPGKEFLSTPMRGEVRRCEMAFEKAAQGKTVAMVCSGDAGVYGMAELICRMGEKYPDTEIEIIPGVTAALSGAALLGAPLNHDFCVISLSDLLTPWETIEKRLRMAAQADFVTVLYNPASHKRKDYLSRACACMLEYKPPQTVCGIVENIGREGERQQVMTLEGLKNTPVNMFTTVFIGNSQTIRAGERMITPRGYRDE